MLNSYFLLKTPNFYFSHCTILSLRSRDVFGIKMLGGVGVAGAENGHICFIEEGPTKQWTEDKFFSGVQQITHIEVFYK